MKKIIVFLVLVLTIVGCSKKVEKTQSIVPEKKINENETILYMINQCIDDYNNDLIKTREEEWNTTIKPIPIEIEKIDNITSLNQLKNVKDKYNVDSALYVGSYKINNYDMIFKIYNYGNNFWLYGAVDFEININSITVNNEKFSEIKQTLDSLLSEDRKIIKLLYGQDVSVNEDIQKESYYKVEKLSDYNFKSIQELKNKAESIFTKEYLEEFYNIAFNNDNPIYKEIDGILYVSSLEDTNLSQGLPYDTSRIIAIKETDTEILVDLVIAFDDDIINNVQRIILTKTDSGLRLNNIY